MLFIKKIIFLLGISFASPVVLAESIEDIAARQFADNEAVNIYGGKVGKLPAVFFIEWAGKEIFGHYYHPRRKNKTYTLRGKNTKPGALVLKEYTPLGNGNSKMTALIKLKKKIRKGRVIWSGTMYNTDGRELAVYFSRKLR